MRIRKTLKRIKFFVFDNLDVITGRRNPMIPPNHIVNINAGDSEAIGQEFLKYFIELGDLEREADVLDVGSGFGRMAVPLTNYLTPKSRYEGLEIIANGVDWCTKNITKRYKNFTFQKLDVKNGRYNPSGEVLAVDYKFPFEDDVFDFVILTSVFTHMLPADLENYLTEITRVLKTGGKCFITYFILNDKSISMINENKSHFSLKHKYGDCRIESLEDPEYVIAYPENKIIDIYKKRNIEVLNTYYGNWSGREQFTSFQDILVGKKIGK